MTRLTLAVAALALVPLGGCALQPNENTFPGQVATGDDGYTVTVRFDEVENLVPNSNVQRDNVVIGTVAAIDVRDWQAEVTLRLKDDVPIPEDATFSIGQKTLLGAQYVEVSPGKPGAAATRLEEGAVVPVEQTGTYPATEQVLGAAALLLNNGGLPQISTITGQLSMALRSRVPNARALVARTNELLGTLDANRDDIVRALESLDRLGGRLAAERGTVARGLDRIGPALHALNEERGHLVRALTSAGALSSDATRLVVVNEQALLGNLDSLAPILTRLQQVSRRLPEALKIGVTIPFPAMTTTDAISGDFANLFTTLDLSLPSLADAWLKASTPPALDAGDPVTGPLGQQQKSPLPLPALPGLPAPPLIGGSCLLGLLGACS